MNSIKVFESEWGYEMIPPEIEEIAVWRKDGYPDMRYKSSKRVLEWIKEVQQKGKLKNEKLS